MKPPKVLVTGGATREPIDSVRFISNLSSGRTALYLAERLSSSGFDVTAALSEGVSIPEAPSFEVLRFSDTQSLAKLMKKFLQNEKAQALIHAAAVSDYYVEKLWVDHQEYSGAALRSLKKIPSSGALRLELGRHSKIINEIRSWARPDLKLVGFKLNDAAGEGTREASVQKLFQEAACSAVVQNEVSEISALENRKFRFYTQAGQEVKELKGLGELAQHLTTYLGNLTL